MPRPTFNEVLARFPTAYPPTRRKALRQQEYWERYNLETAGLIANMLLPAYSILELDAPTGVSVTATPATFTAWNVQWNTEEALMSADSTTGLITATEPFILEFALVMNASLANNVTLIMTATKSGSSPIPYQAVATGTGSGFDSSLNLSGVFVMDAGETAFVEVNRGSGSSTITFGSCTFLAKYSPYVDLVELRT